MTERKIIGLLKFYSLRIDCCAMIYTEDKEEINPSSVVLYLVYFLY